MRTPILLAVVLLSLPTSWAGWTSHGQREPDTALDADAPTLLWPDAPPAGTSRVYFHAYPTLSESGVNPHVAALGTHYRLAPLVRFQAVLGAWSDCNADGYVGLAEGALESYPAALLLDARACPAGSAHNDGATVRELLSIGRGPETPLRDDDALVWGDAGEPGAPGYEACRVLPLPRGTTSNTGRALRVLDCASEHRVIGLVNTVDNDGSLGLAIEDPHHPEQSGSLLVRNLPVSLFGNPMNGQPGLLQHDAGAPAFTLWDCDAGGVGQPAFAPDPTSASWWEAAEHVADGAAGDCDPSTPSPIAPFHPALEQPFEPTSHVGRDQNDVVFAFGVVEPPRLTLEPWQGASLAPTPFALPQGPPPAEPRWRALSSFVSAPRALDRGTLEPSGGASWTFYADVGLATHARGLALPGGSGTYGAEACAGATTGVRNGWRCDPGQWWLDPAGDAMPRDAAGRPWGARVGQSYELRDVDCEDALAWHLADDVCDRP